MFKRKALGEEKNGMTSHIVVGRDNQGIITIYGFASGEVAFLIVENRERYNQFTAVGNYDGMKLFFNNLCGDYPRAVSVKDVKAAGKFVKKKQEYDPRKLIEHMQKKTGLCPLVGTVPYKDNDERKLCAALPFMSQDKMNKYLTGV